MALPSALFRPRRLLDHFGRDKHGTAAVEFAMLAIPFLGLLFAIIELGMIYLIATSLSSATIHEARNIRTCQFQSQGTTKAQFLADVCSDPAMNWMGSMCNTNLQIDVNTYTSFQNTNNPPVPITNGVFNPNALTFQMGNAGDIVLVRTFYPWTLVAPGLDGLVAQTSSGQYVIEAASAFRNEPCT